MGSAAGAGRRRKRKTRATASATVCDASRAVLAHGGSILRHPMVESRARWTGKRRWTSSDAARRSPRSSGAPERVKRQHDGGRLTIRERVARLADAGSFHELGQDRRARRLRRAERPRAPHALQLHLRPGQGRRSSGGDRRRRLHGARRLGRRHDQGQAQHVRADGPRPPPAADPAGRGLRRRRLGEDHRDRRPRQRSGRRRLGAGRAATWARSRAWPSASAPSRGSAPRTWPPRTTP